MKTVHYFLLVGVGLFLTSAHAEDAPSPNNDQKSTTEQKKEDFNRKLLEKRVFSGESPGSSSTY